MSSRTKLVTRLVALLLCTTAASATPLATLGAQWSETYEQMYFDAPYAGELRHRFVAIERQLAAIELGRARAYETLWRDPRVGDEALYRTIAVSPSDAPRLAGDVGPAERAFRMLVPEAAAVIEWTQAFRRRVLDVLADASLTDADREGRLTELLGYYRGRGDLALSARPKDVGALNSTSSLAFRKRYPRSNGVLWSAQWLEAAAAEPLLVAKNGAEQRRLLERSVDRYRRMLASPPASAPYLMPMTAQVAPETGRRYPEIAAILDNLHMLEDNVADILVDPEVPRSAKRQDILRAAAFFRNDSASALSYGDWLAMGERIGVNNMGGLAMGAGVELPGPTVPLGMSLAGMSPAKPMAGMEHAGMEMRQAPSGRQDLEAIYQRMMADPVIRERVATDPVLQRMIAASGVSGAGGAMGGGGMGGMGGMGGGGGGGGGGAAPGMTGMDMPAAAGAAAAATTPSDSADRRMANEFIALLLSDSTIAARIHASPDLHSLWSDPDVQRRIRELRGATPAPARQPDTKARRAPKPPPPQPSHGQHPPGGTQR